MAGCHIEADELVTAVGLEPSSITSLMPLWLVVLIADGDEPSTAFSPGLLNDIWCSNPVSQSKLSSICWLGVDMSAIPLPKGDVGSSDMECGDSL